MGPERIELSASERGAVEGFAASRITRGARGDRRASGRFALAAFPRPLPPAARLPGGANRVSVQTKTRTQIHPISRSSLEETLEADISTLHKPDIPTLR
jgi:hypothetical protein